VPAQVSLQFGIVRCSARCHPPPCGAACLRECHRRHRLRPRRPRPRRPRLGQTPHSRRRRPPRLADPLALVDRATGLCNTQVLGLSARRVRCRRLEFRTARPPIGWRADLAPLLVGWRLCADSGRSGSHYRTAGVDPKQPFVVRAGNGSCCPKRPPIGCAKPAGPSLGLFYSS
jgi:hypothetical protein